MGWYHVNNTGKGIVLGYGKDIHYNEEFFANYVPTKEEVLKTARTIRKEDLEGYETWPLYVKFAAAADDSWALQRARNRGNSYLEKDAYQFYTEALHTAFEKSYGYPGGSFRSVCDYDGNAMIFCCTMWPPETYNENLATLTEEKLQTQLREFLVKATGDSKYAKSELEVCEEYIKE